MPIDKNFADNHTIKSMIKKKKKTSHKNKSIKKYIKGGTTLYILLFVIIIASAFMAGFFTKIKSRPGLIDAPIVVKCCDTGDGDECKPQDDKTIEYQGAQYGLIRTKVNLVEGNLHLKDSGEKVKIEGTDYPVILNPSETHNLSHTEMNIACDRPDPITTKKDLYFKKMPPDPMMFMKYSFPGNVIAEYCTSIPDDQIIFVCKKNCEPQPCSLPGANVPCYGDEQSEYDVYFKMSDYPDPGIPPFIKNCDKTPPQGPLPTGLKQRIIPGTNNDPHNNLQLNTFLIGLEGNINPWLSPFCKPAIYLYPEKETNINVKIASKGQISLTIPNYPNNGWQVTAYPNGKIIDNNKTFDYLYYEAKIPNDLIDNKTNQGYVVKYEELEQTLKDLLIKLGLNEKEKKDFIEYWLKVLPSSNYYFVGIVPEKTLNDISPLSISPKPDTIIRVALYFKPLDSDSIGVDKKVQVSEPNFQEIKRKGFTVVEWGGLFKTDENHPFTCLM